MAAFADLAEHTGTLIAFISTLLGVCGVLLGVIWWMMTRVVLTLKTDILGLIEKVDNRVGTAFEIIENHRLEQANINQKVQERQERIREEWPEKYLRIEGPGYKAIIDSLKRIEDEIKER